MNGGIKWIARVGYKRKWRVGVVSWRSRKAKRNGLMPVGLRALTSLAMSAGALALLALWKSARAYLPRRERDTEPASDNVILDALVLVGHIAWVASNAGER